MIAMTQQIKNPIRFAASLLLISIGIGACSAPSTPAGSSDKSFGATGVTMADFYYPKQAGVTYVYRNTISEYASNGNQLLSTYLGSTDTLRTLGYQGYNSPEGDPVYAFSVTYRVSPERNNKDVFPIYYVKKGSSNNGGFIAGNNPAGISNVSSINAVSSAIDTILYAVEGPARDIIDNVSSSGNVYRTDILYFTSTATEIKIWWSENGTMRETRLVWDGETIRNADWAYAAAVGDPYTTWTIKDGSTQVQTGAGSFNAAKVEVYTENLNTSTTEYKWWAPNTGLVKQFDEWRVTSDGQNFRRKTKVRELISIN
jgi:hypothetical protein